MTWDWTLVFWTIGEHSNNYTNGLVLSHLIIYLYIIYIKIKVSKLAIIVEGKLKGPFSIATTLIYRGGHYSFPWIAPLTIDPYLIMLSVKQDSIKY